MNIKSITTTASSRFLALTTLCLLPSAHGAVLIESFESGTLNGWSAGTLNTITTTVNTNHASAGTYSAANSFTVPGSFGGWGHREIMSIDPRGFMDENTLTLSLDVFSDWSNTNNWGVYGNTIWLTLNYQGGWVQVNPTSGSLSNGSFQTITYDMTPYASAITNPGLSYSFIRFDWFLGTWAGDGFGGTYTDNGTQTFALDNIRITSSVPEPTTVTLFGALAGLSVLRRRRL